MRRGLALSEAARVLRIITRLNVGGPSRQALMLTKALLPDFDTLLAAGRPLPHEGEMTDPEVQVRHVPLVRPLRPWSDIRAATAIKSLIRTWQPQIVHTHQAKAGALARLVAGGTSKHPMTIHTFHGHVLEGYFGSAARAFFIATERSLAKRSHILIAISMEVRDELLTLGIGTEDQWRVIPLGLDLEPFLSLNGTHEGLRRSLGLTSDVPLVGVVGRLSPIKDHITLLEAIARLRGVHLAVFGDGELREDLQRKVAQLGIADRVHFMGWWTDVAAVMHGLDVVALTSRNEGTPVSLIEASASGLPVVATDVGGVRSVVLDGLSGLLVPTRSPDRVAEALRAVLADHQAGSRMGAAGRAFVAERFAQDRLVADIRALYSSLIGNA